MYQALTDKIFVDLSLNDTLQDMTEQAETLAVTLRTRLDEGFELVGTGDDHGDLTAVLCRTDENYGVSTNNPASESVVIPVKA
jgi:hypothetical protein